MLKIEDLRFSYSRRSAPVLNGVDLELRDGEIGILLGKNGSGKTTLFKNILGIGTPSGGTIRFDGEDLLKLPKRDRARRIAYVPQHIHFGALTVYDSILMGSSKIQSIPAITANHPDAQLIHEAAIGRIAGDQILKLMTLGLTEEEAEEEILRGFLG